MRWLYTRLTPAASGAAAAGAASGDAVGKGGDIVHSYSNGDFCSSISFSEERLIEEYRLPGRSTYARLFDYGIVLYNPEADDDVAIPLGGEYVDPYDVSCKRVHTYARLAGQTGAILVRL